MAGGSSYFDPVRPDARRNPDVRHDYTSTSCVHGQHRDCTVYCAWCVARCGCQCHQYGLI